MKAIVFSKHGQLDKVSLADVPMPTVAPNEVLVQVKAAALNRLDLWVLAGWASLKLAMPHVMGSDGAGIIIQIGTNVTGYQVGDRVAINPSVTCGTCHYCLTGRDNMCDHFAVFGEHVPGFYGEYRNVPTRNLLKLPDHVSFADAAAASLVYVTAWHSMVKRGGLQAGEDVLIVGAGGGVNTAAIQIARLAGAKTIYVIGSTAEKLALAESLGADVLISRTENENWSKAIFKASNRKGVDMVVDNVGAASYHHSLRALKKGGRLLTVGNTSGAQFQFDNRLMFGKHLSILGSTMGTIADYEAVMGLVFAGKLRPIIDTIYPLSEGLTALHRLESGDVTGKLIIEP
jgi:NADPH:quinone reductase-like Zn-dependent oxidoreductase